MAASNTDDQFADSTDLREALMDANIDTVESHVAMGAQAPGSERARDGLDDILIGPVRLCEGLGARAASSL